MDGPAGQTSSFYLKPWPVYIFEDFLSVCTLSQLPGPTKALLYEGGEAGESN